MVFCRVRLDNVVNPAAGINAPQALMSALCQKRTSRHLFDHLVRTPYERRVPSSSGEPRLME